MTSKPTLKDAIELATKHHKGQFDKGGQPYIGHPLRIMEKMTLEDEKIVAILHDIVEDTDITLHFTYSYEIPNHLVFVYNNLKF